MLPFLAVFTRYTSHAVHHMGQRGGVTCRFAVYSCCIVVRDTHTLFPIAPRVCGSVVYSVTNDSPTGLTLHTRPKHRLLCTLLEGQWEPRSAGAVLEYGVGGPVLGRVHLRRHVPCSLIHGGGRTGGNACDQSRCVHHKEAHLRGSHVIHDLPVKLHCVASARHFDLTHLS